MRAEWVLDASVAAKCLFTEPGSDTAREFVASGDTFTAPDFIFAELASIAAKKVRRGEVPVSYGAEALARAPGLLAEAARTPSLVGRAFHLAAEHGFSAYDALYLSLAQQRGAKLLTADAKLVGRARGAGLSSLVVALSG